MKLNNVKKNLKAGFSLVEMLVVIAVIGVITAIAIPAISGILAEAETAKNERNAQSAVSVFSAATAAGADLSAATTPALAIDALALGVSPTTGVFTGKQFILDIHPDEEVAAAALLAISTDGLLVFAN
ncbi:hypothetical protein BH23VER1_BH23VER1_06360 [soil metagenome]